MSETHEISKAAVHGTFWIYLAYLISKGLTFIANIILARLLLPEDFGLLALGLVVINYIDNFADFGVGTALIYRQGEVKKAATNAFWLSSGSGVLLSGISVLLAPWMASFFGEARLTPVIQALALTVLITSLGNVHAALIKKELDFKRRMLPEIARAFTKGFVSIGLALAGMGVWSLVWGQIAATAVTTLLYWKVVPWMPRLQLDTKIARELVQYGSQILMVGLLGYALMNMDYLFIGRRMAAEQLGYYTMAFRVPELIILNICNVVSQAIFPAYAKLQNDLSALKKGYLLTLRYVALFTIPAGIGMAMISHEFVNLFYTSRWQPAVPVMQALSIFTMFYSLSFNAGDVFKATGRAGLLNWIGLVRLVLTLPLFWWASGQSIFMVAVCQILVILLVSPVQIHYVKKIIHVRTAEILSALKTPAIAGAVMLVAVAIISRLQPDAPAVLRLSSMAVTGLLVYLAVIWFSNPEMLLQAVRIISSGKKTLPKAAEQASR